MDRSSHVNPILLPLIRGDAGFGKANPGARGDGCGRLTPISFAAEPPPATRCGGRLDSAPGATGALRGGPTSVSNAQALQLRFLLGLREVSLSAEETAAAPPS